MRLKNLGQGLPNQTFNVDGLDITADFQLWFYSSVTITGFFALKARQLTFRYAEENGDALK